jgi:hypothetical protein
MVRRLVLAYRKIADARREQREHDLMLEDPRTAAEHDLAVRRSGASECPYCR